MRKPMLYVVAGIASMLLILGGWYFVRTSERLLLSQFEEHKQQLREMRDVGKLPRELQGVDIDAMELEHMAIKLPRGLEERLEVAHLFQSYWFVLAPLAFAICFGVAWVAGKMLPAGK